MDKKNRAILFVGSVGMLILIFDGKTAIAGMQEGIEICLRTLIPSLFPFFVLTGVLTTTLIGQPIKYLQRIGELCHIPRGCESLFAVGILGGYPVGAGNIWNIHDKGHLSLEEANRLVVFCNNSGPSFLFGVLSPLFPDWHWVWLLWLIQICAAVLTGSLLPGSSETTDMAADYRTSISEIVNRAVRSMGAVCGWVVLFRMLLEFLNRWFLWMFPVPVQVTLTGFLELSNGCLRLQEIEDVHLRFLLSACLLSFGGICIILQTQSVFPRLIIRQYLSGRMLHLGFTLALSIAAVFLISGRILSFTGILGIVIVSVSICHHSVRIRKKEVAIP